MCALLYEKYEQNKCDGLENGLAVLITFVWMRNIQIYEIHRQLEFSVNRSHLNTTFTTPVTTQYTASRARNLPVQNAISKLLKDTYPPG